MTEAPANPVPGYERHALSKAWPDLDGEAKRSLEESLRKQGFDPLQPVVLYDGQILDGWQRYTIAREMNIMPVFARYDGDDPAGFVIGRQKGRRHLSKMKIARAVALCRGWRPAAGGRPKRAQNDQVSREDRPRTNAEMAEEAGVSPATIRRAKTDIRDEKKTADGTADARPETGNGERPRPKDKARHAAEPADDGRPADEEPEPRHLPRPTVSVWNAAGPLNNHRLELSELVKEAARNSAARNDWEPFRRELFVAEWAKFFRTLGVMVTIRFPDGKVESGQD